MDTMSHNRAEHELAVAYALQSLQQSHGLSRQRLADAMEISELEVTRLENGSESLSAGALIVLLKACEVPWKQFEAMVDAELPKAREQIHNASHSPTV